ncbi:molybdopterin-dependent oxidoreductase [Mycolicibacterium gadium]|uniref:Molybdopterin-dependent oxidoreductase n=1 Tax=Mycolicibacterium gadium TaxID=1794 RepID=A0ABT6GUS3_MYCGU|nr:molybdopterin-dependent oxidoreductase [Mycolicibacterium gadium]MDG5485422.1 molybdopterin-dependent oxidoreductase [Mycolicibacterium gadium]
MTAILAERPNPPLASPTSALSHVGGNPEPLRQRMSRMTPTSRLPAVRAALTGLIAVFAALGVGHLISGLILTPAASPFLAVGNAAIDRTPAAVKDFAITHFGTNDKPALLVGMAVALVLFGVLLGLMSRRSVVPGLAAIVFLGVVGTLAVAEQSTGWLGLLAPLASLLAGVGAFWWLHRRAQPRPVDAIHDADAGAGEAADDVPTRGLGRRRFVLSSLAATLGALVAGAGGFALGKRIDVTASRRAVGELVPTTPAPPIPAGAAFPKLGTPTFITPAADFYRIDINLTVPQLRAEDAVLRITGMVDTPVEFTFDEIRSMPLVEKTITMTCVSNEVGGPYVSTANFIGVPLLDLLDQAGIQDGAQQVVGHSVDGFTLGTPLDLLRNAGKEALLAIGMNREALLPEHGFPMRTVVPGLYGYVSATKWLTELELATYNIKPYWVERGWDGQPPGVVPIKISSRIDAPSSFQRVPSGDVTVAGTAWAQGRGISKVELRFDNEEWQPAELATEVNRNTWRMFRLTRPLAPGQHTVTSRAFDGSGVMQAEDRLRLINPGPVPDGSTGWQSMFFTVG